MPASIFQHFINRPALHRRLKTAAGSALVAAVLSGCVSASSSFQLPPTYGHQPDGNYLLSSWERGLDCTGLHLALDQRLKQLLRIANAEKTAREGLPRTLMEAVSWKTGNPTGYGKRFKSHQLLRAEALSLHQAAGGKKCPQKINLQQQLAETQLPGQQPDVVYKTAAGQPGPHNFVPAATPPLSGGKVRPDSTASVPPAL